MNSKIEPLYYWCQKVLPLVYDDSLSYYEVLCKMRDYINDLIVSVNNNSDNICGLNEAFLQLQDWINDYFDNLDVQTEVKNAIARMIASGEFQAIVDSSMTARVNLGSLVENLSSDNFKVALQLALKYTPYIYIPAGNYDLSVIGTLTFTDEVDVVCSDKAVFSYIDIPNMTNTLDTLFNIHNCNSFKWYGGEFNVGTASSPKSMYYNSKSGLDGSTFRVTESKNVSFEKMNFLRNALPNAISFEDTANCEVKKCFFDNLVESGIHLFGHCQNTTIDDCVIKNVVIPDNYKLEKVYYCYFICTGLHTLSESTVENPITPPDNFIVRNCICINSEDSGIDTHGATNVIFENNVIINSGACITAYNDSNRVIRPKGWVMRNIIIRNNYCKSNVLPPLIEGTDYPGHPYVLIASANKKARDSEGYIIENNYFETVNSYNDYGVAIMPTGRLKNIYIANCTFVNNDPRGKHGIYCKNTSNATIRNCTLKDSSNNSAFLCSVDNGSNVDIKNCSSYNGRTVVCTDQDNTLCHIETDNFDYYYQQFVRRNEIVTKVGTDKAYVCSSYYTCGRTKAFGATGIRVTSVGNMRCKVKGITGLFLGCGVDITESGTLIKGYVSDILSDDEVLVQCESALTSGVYNVKVTKASMTV